MRDDTEAEVHRLVSSLDYPMFIVTAAADDQIAGCLVGFATQCSIDPPRFLVCLSEKNHTFAVALKSDTLIVHMVPSDATELVELFGAQTGDEIDKFAQCGWRRGPADTPVLERCHNWFAGRILSRIAAGDHHAFLLEPFEAESERAGRQFDFHRAKRLEPGHQA